MKVSRYIFDIPYEYWYLYPHGDSLHITSMPSMSEEKFRSYDFKPFFAGLLTNNRFDMSEVSPNDKHFFVFDFPDDNMIREVYMFSLTDGDQYSNLLIKETFEGTIDECLLRKLSW